MTLNETLSSFISDYIVDRFPCGGDGRRVKQAHISQIHTHTHYVCAYEFDPAIPATRVGRWDVDDTRKDAPCDSTYDHIPCTESLIR